MILVLDLDQGLVFVVKRRFRFGEKAKTLSLGLNFEGERDITVVFGSILKRGGEIILEELELFEE